tara:strand:+ start:12220 stop:12453 length:234 start_codon:yes stop_codon:yes gene_type:complete
MSPLQQLKAILNGLYVATRTAGMSADEHERARQGAETLMRFLEKQPEESVTADDVAGSGGVVANQSAETADDNEEGA